jgi:hypothetical protein
MEALCRQARIRRFHGRVLAPVVRGRRGFGTGVRTVSGAFASFVGGGRVNRAAPPALVDDGAWRRPYHRSREPGRDGAGSKCGLPWRLARGRYRFRCATVHSTGFADDGCSDRAPSGSVRWLGGAYKIRGAGGADRVPGVGVKVMSGRGERRLASWSSRPVSTRTESRAGRQVLAGNVPDRGRRARDGRR